ncbi:lipocalin-like domain-containing protein [Chryseobacterium gwangjuense]|uniref:lipocalin family protein n=1 Tax=Chryseobacterium gwangjuense TaxID=1069980 RepID=UPI001E3154B2|nr:lipocalin family protein [Chryseobacterium gwangjuense]MCE3077197.1 lipocalin family protein [Chryseobacterium gwangjuense]
MKKLALLFAGLSLLSISACKDDNSEQVFPLAGTWSPIKEVRTTIPASGGGVSDEITYTDCEKASRWVFNEGSTGKRKDSDDDPVNAGQCIVSPDRTFTYIYNEDKSIQIKYMGTVEPDKGKVTLLNETTLNLAIEDRTDPTVYKSVTYTMKRIVK